jgi:beta-glucosidase
MDEQINALIAQMTLEEEISLLAGADMWHTVPIERLSIPALKMTDGPSGARGEDAPDGPTSACFPCGTALGATWNPDLVERVAGALAEEVKSKGGHILLGPTVNIHRSPLAGRNFECYSEDPYLTARLATAYIHGLQKVGVGACIKHFVCNDSEFERHSMSSEVAERPLRELYMRPFEIAIRDAKPWAVMSAYNRVNGTYACEHVYTLRKILKGEWGFDGLVMSDWFGTYDANVVKGGLDLEMPGPARWMGKAALEAARNGKVTQAEIDDKVRRLLRTLFRAGAFERPEPRAERAIDKPEHRQLARETAAKAIVLLKNEKGILPLEGLRAQTIAVIGENAKWASIMGGGSVRVWPHYVVSPLSAIQQRAGASTFRYALGCSIHKNTPRFDTDWLNGPLTLQYFANAELKGEPVHTVMILKPELVWFGETDPYVDLSVFSARLTGSFAVQTSGKYVLSLTCVGRARLFVGGEELIQLWASPAQREERIHTAEIELSAGKSYPLKIEYASEPGPIWRNLRLGGMANLPDDPIGEAVQLAGQSDVAIVFPGLTNEWESEGFDRADMELPGDQAELIERVSLTNPNTVVVLNAGSPTTMKWLNNVPAVLQAWYMGQETGNAIADVLFGEVNPSGRLPTTFPKRLQDNPAFLDYPGENGHVHYAEGLYVGYRYYDKKDIEPLFPFGFGLSYTTFAYRNLIIEMGDVIRVGVLVQNTGDRAGTETVQLYVHDVKSRLARPEKELKAFAQVALEPGESKTVILTLDEEALAYYDDAIGGWTTEAGEFDLLVGSSSRDIRLCRRLDYTPPSTTPRKASANTGMPLRRLLDDPRGKAVLNKYSRAVLDNPEIQMIWSMSLEQIAVLAPDILTPQVLQAINLELAKE